MLVARFKEETKDIWANYYPVYTEASGVLDLGSAVVSLAAIYKMQNSQEVGFDFVLTPMRCMCESAFLFARGLTKLALPIIGVTAYLGYRSFN